MSQQHHDPRKRIRLSNPWHLLAVGFGSGLSKYIPGTMGTLASIPFYLLLIHTSIEVYTTVVICASIVGIVICQRTSDDMQVHDHGSIVWDEFVGFWITMWVVSFQQLDGFDIELLLVGFVLFRFFDMVKPWPIRWLDRHVHGGFGIMIDDVLAGIMAGVGLWGYIEYLA